MLYVLFQAGTDRYLVESARIVEVLPLVHWRPVPDAPRGVVGMLNFHGMPVPLVDFGLLMTGVATASRIGARILVVRVVTGKASDDTASEPDALVALLVAAVAGTRRCPTAEFTTPPELANTAPFLGPVIADANGIVQRIELDRLITPDARLAMLEHVVGAA